MELLPSRTGRRNAVRIIAGEKRGTRLKSPKGNRTRPTLDRVRESLFMMLGPYLEGARVLDLFAGAGTLGLEALSRGATHATFVEISRPALDALRDNIGKLGWKDRSQVLDVDARRFFSAKSGADSAAQPPWDLIFCDAPYEKGYTEKVLQKIADSAIPVLANEGQVIAQIGRHERLEASYGTLTRVREKSYGDTQICIYAVQDDLTASGAAE